MPEPELKNRLRRRLFYLLVGLLKPLMPWLAKRPLAWRIRAAFFRGGRDESWLGTYGPHWDTPTGHHALNLALIVDLRGAAPQDLKRLPEALAGLPNTTATIWLTEDSSPENLVSAIPQSVLSPEGAVLYLTAACRPHPLLPRRYAAALAEEPEAALWYADESQRLADNSVKMFAKPAWDPLYQLHRAYVGECFLMRGPLAVRALKALDQLPPRGQGFFEVALNSLDEGLVAHLPMPLHEIDAASLPPPPPAPAARPRSCQPRVSIIIPFRDRPDLLKPCLKTLFEVTSYPDWECLLVDNGSVDAEITALLANPPDKRIRVLAHDAPFNFSELVNLGAATAYGDVLVLLNNDITVLYPNWLEVLVSYVNHPEIACAGAKLLYPNGLVQHAGMLLCAAGLDLDGHPTPGAAHAGWPGDSDGYFGSLASPRLVSAITGAALAVRRELYFRLGGFDEDLTVAFNDVDFCLKAWAAGFACVFTPESVLIHHESASRKMDRVDRSKMERLTKEWRLMRQRWGAMLETDLWYSPNLSSDSAYELRSPPGERGPRVTKARIY
jgi:GT2 family glycosyltransferase